MIRGLALLAAFLGLAFLVGTADAAAQKNQMVKGTVKSADPTKNLLIVNQKVKNESVDRELSIKDDTDFVVTDAKGNVTNASGKEGLRLLIDHAGADVQVKCDKDVNVLKVTAKLKK